MDNVQLEKDAKAMTKTKDPAAPRTEFRAVGEEKYHVEVRGLSVCLAGRRDI